MDEKDFEILRVLNETRNVTRTAERLYLTQSALSKRLKQIENELNITLTFRTRQGIRFTSTGEAMLPYVFSAAGTLEQMRRDLDALQGDVCGILRVGAVTTYATYRLPSVLKKYCSRYPRVRVDLFTGSSSEVHQKMVDGTLDVAILRGEFPWDDQYLLFQDPLCVAQAQAGPLKDMLYLSRQMATAQNSMISLWMRENGLLPLRRHLNVGTLPVCLAMVQQGLGWAVLPEICLDGFQGTVTPCTYQDGELLTRRTSVLCQKEARHLPQVTVFLDLVKQSVRPRPESGS